LTRNIQLSVFLISGVLLSIFLLTRPKYVVKKENGQTSQNQSENSAKNTTHTLSKELLTRLDNIRANTQLSIQEKNRQIAEAFFIQSVFDSAAYYFEKNLAVNNSTENILKVADSYNQALGLSLDPTKIEVYAQKARDFYNKVLKKDPENLYAKTNLASTYIKSETPMAAINLLREVIEANPNYVPALMTMGGMSMQSGQYDKAVNRFEKVISIDPNNQNAKMGLAYSFLELGKKEEAKVLFEKILKEDIPETTKAELRNTLKSIN
jgi:outer membrane protein